MSLPKAKTIKCTLEGIEYKISLEEMQMQKGYIHCAISKSHVSTSGDLYNDEGYRE